VRQSIRGYTDAVIEQASAPGELTRTANELAGLVALIESSQELRSVLTDPNISVPSRRAVVTDLLQSQVGSDTLRLVTHVQAVDRATEFQDDLTWLADRLDAAARDLESIGEVVLGRHAAEERVDGYATGVLERVEDRDALDGIEDELFRFMRTVMGSDELQAAVSSRDLPLVARRGLVLDLLRGRASQTTVSLAAYATLVGRPRDYQDLLSHLVDRVAAETDRRLADVRTPVDLDATRRQHLAAALGRIAGRPVDVRVTVDPAVLGGFVATIGDTVVDGSIRHRLDLLKERLAVPEAEITSGDPS
jgi:F-type H+-transporting ATPase subunit delta